MGRKKTGDTVLARIYISKKTGKKVYYYKNRRKNECVDRMDNVHKRSVARDKTAWQKVSSMLDDNAFGDEAKTDDDHGSYVWRSSGVLTESIC